MNFVISSQKSRINWLLSNIIEENGFLDKKATAEDLEGVVEGILSLNCLNILSEIYMSYPTASV